MPEPDLVEPDDGLSTGAAFLVSAIVNARVSELQEAFRHLGWPIRFEVAELPEQPARHAPASVCECGTSPDPGLCPDDHDNTLLAGAHCACLHTKSVRDA